MLKEMFNPQNYFWNPYSIPVFLTGVIFIFLGLFVGLKNKNLLNLSFSTWIFFASFWLFGNSFTYMAKHDWLVIELYNKFEFLGVCFISIAIYWNSLCWDKDLLKKQRKYVIIGIIINIIIYLTNLKFNYILSGTYKYFWGRYFKIGIGGTIFLFYWFIPLLLSLINYIKLYRKADGIEKKRYKLIIIATSIIYFGVTDWLPCYGLEIYPFGYIPVLIFSFLISYAIVRYRLLEIEVIIRKTLVFAGLSAFVFGAFVGTAYLAQTFWTKINGSEYLAMAIAVLVIVLVQEPLKNILIKYTDGFLLQKKYDYQKILKDASEGMAMVRELKWLLGLITHIVSSKMRVSNIGIFLQEDDGDPNHYYLKAKRGKEPIEQNFLSSDNPICLWLKENKRPLVLEEVDYLLQRKKISSSETSLKNILVRIKNQMEGLNAKIILPSFYKGGLLGFLSLGYKLSGDIYTKEDLVLLSTLSNSSAIAIENARLFDNLIDEIEINNHLRKEEEESYMQMMMSLAKTIDAKDSYTYDHVEMVYQYGVDLTQYLPGVNKDALKASLRLHDLGKIGVPDSILSKQGPLTPEEWKKVKDHTILGARILAPLKRFEYVAKVILHHQEKFDGTGYPAGLKGDQIPLESRIIAVVDAYHAMVSDRPYRKALPKHAAIAELRKFSGTQFDPIVVEAFLKLLEEKYGITETA